MLTGHVLLHFDGALEAAGRGGHVRLLGGGAPRELDSGRRSGDAL
jgi:hypothetical protein